jgi:hypothetical protein
MFTSLAVNHHGDAGIGRSGGPGAGVAAGVSPMGIIGPFALTVVLADI